VPLALSAGVTTPEAVNISYLAEPLAPSADSAAAAANASAIVACAAAGPAADGVLPFECAVRAGYAAQVTFSWASGAWRGEGGFRGWRGEGGGNMCVSFVCNTFSLASITQTYQFNAL
jgi:subtilisin family serine protease